MADPYRQVQASRPTDVSRGKLRIHDYGDEVHLMIEQRVPWPVALEILKELKTPGPHHEATSRARRAREAAPLKPSPAGRGERRWAA